MLYPEIGLSLQDFHHYFVLCEMSDYEGTKIRDKILEEYDITEQVFAKTIVLLEDAFNFISDESE